MSGARGKRAGSSKDRRNEEASLRSTSGEGVAMTPADHRNNIVKRPPSPPRSSEAALAMWSERGSPGRPGRTVGDVEFEINFAPPFQPITVKDAPDLCVPPLYPHDR